MRITSNSPALLAGLAAVFILLGCEPRPYAPSEPQDDAESRASIQPQASTARRGYNLSKVPQEFFAAPGTRAPRGFGASPDLSPSMLEALARTLYVVNGSFERNGGVGSNAFAAWTVVDRPEESGSWFVQAGAASPLNGFIAFTPPAGQFAAMTDQGGPGTHILYQDVRVPRGQSTLSFRVSLFNHPGVYFAPNTLRIDRVPNQQFRMDIMAPLARVDGLGQGVLQRVFRTEPGDPPLQGYRTITTSLTPFAGRSVRLRFTEVDNLGNFQVGIDQVRIITE
jgi:hypothetical protein